MPPLQPSKTPSRPPPRTHSLHNTKTSRRSWDRRSKPERSLKTMPARRLARKAGVKGPHRWRAAAGTPPLARSKRHAAHQARVLARLAFCRNAVALPATHANIAIASRHPGPFPTRPHNPSAPAGATPCPSRRGNEASPMTRAGARKRPRPGATGLSRAPVAHPRRTRRPARRRRT